MGVRVWVQGKGHARQHRGCLRSATAFRSADGIEAGLKNSEADTRKTGLNLRNFDAETKRIGGHSREARPGLRKAVRSVAIVGT